MSVYDLVVHAVRTPVEADLFALDRAELAEDLAERSREMSAHGVRRGLLAIFDSSALAWVSDVAESRVFDIAAIAQLSDQDPDAQVARLLKVGARAVVFHPYLQKLSHDVWHRATNFAQRAEDAGLLNIVCTAYGSRQMFDVQVLPFAAHLAEALKGPIVFAHGGGAKVLEAMLIAEAWPNVLLDTSFSLSYWMGSSVEGDFAYAMRKLGAGRWLFGSDAPFIALGQALTDHEQFFARHRFASGEIEAIMGGNAARLLEA